MIIGQVGYNKRMKKLSLHEKQVIRLTAGVIGFLLLGTVFYHEFEQLDWLDSFYFSVITLTTIGYGDITPSTDASKIFTIIYAFFGIGFLLAYLDLIGGRRLRKMRERSEDKHEKDKDKN